jgi:hemolysin III
MLDTQTQPNNGHAGHEAQAARLHREERVNALTHAVGCLIGTIGASALLVVVLKRGDRVQIAACALYGAALVAVYLASALSHAFHQSRLRRLFRMLDQGCIFLLIAGTFTPPALTYLRGTLWWVLLGTMWMIALAGFVAKTFCAHRVEAVTTRLHLVLGWMPVLAVKPLISLAPLGMLLWLLAGGLCYSFGVLFLHRDHLPHFHAVWHLLVIAGSACHFVAIWVYCTTAVV